MTDLDMQIPLQHLDRRYRGILSNDTVLLLENQTENVIEQN